ncbi:Little elongation complex subunit 2, partial [Acipenser ruthenus]
FVFNRDTAPKNGSTVFFSRDMYEKYSLAPSLKDLWLMAHSSTLKSEETPAQLNVENTNVKPECPPSLEQDEKSTADPIPMPRVPFPCLSRLTEREQKTYLRLMTINCKYKKCYELRNHQDLQTAVNEEVVEFQKFLQNAAKFCASDYEIISEDAARYTEEYLRACIKKVMVYPAVYLICDSNAEKLSLKYNPQVSITSEALFTLLNNHGPDYKDSWEIPVCIKTVPGEGTSIKKLAFIDSPLPKKEMTTREKNHIFHKETFNLLMNKISFMPVSGLMLDKQAEENVAPWKESGPRATISFDNVDVDFETDVTDLETFGTTSSSSLCKKPKSQSSQIKAALSTEFKRPKSLPSQPDSTSKVTSNDAFSKDHKFIPVCVLPKVEYQVCYGVEALTKSEICHMWTQRLLQSNTVFFVGHIDAFTSKLFMLEEFTPDRIADKFVDFKPVNSLNILHHLLKKVIGLQEGKYLLSHKAGDPLVTIFKDCDGKTATRTTYNLHRAHSSLPQAPSPLSVPWVPLDPTLTLPYHLKHGIVPCTFPPRATANMQGQEVGDVLLCVW